MVNSWRCAAGLIGFMLLSGCASNYTQFGTAPQHPGAQPLKVQQVLDAPEKYAGKHVKLAGLITDLCTHAGCWMEIADAPTGRPLFVQFTYDTTTQRVPPEAKGRRAIVEGKVVTKEISEAQRRHYAEDQGATPEQVAAIKGPETQVQLECPSVQIEGVKPAAPQACEHS